MIEAVRFDPQELTVKVGDTIVWTNHDPFPHTASAVGKQFDSHEIAAGRSWKFTARKKGVFPYACRLHPTMLGTLRVE
jgi:plastocyanin